MVALLKGKIGNRLYKKVLRLFYKQESGIGVKGRPGKQILCDLKKTQNKTFIMLRE